MKQILKYFSVLLFTVIAISCSSDDSNTEIKELIVKADKNAVDEGGIVTFSAVDGNNNVVTDVDFYVNNVKINNPYKFDKKGTFNVIGRKNGYNVSTPKAILVGKTLNKKLELVADKLEIVAGENVLLKVLSNGEPVEDFYIESLGQGLISGTSWTALKEGVYKLYAFKGEYLNSDIVTITVKDKPIVDNQYFNLLGTKYGIEEVWLGVHSQEEYDENPRPYLYTDKSNGKKFQVYEIAAFNKVRQAFASYVIGVYVVENETKFVYPSDADAKDVFSIGGVGVLGNNPVMTYAAKDIDAVYVNWVKPLDPYDPKNPNKVNKGKIDYKLHTKDKKLDLVYEGEFSGLRYVTIPKDTKSVKQAFVYKSSR